MSYLRWAGLGFGALFLGAAAWLWAPLPSHPSSEKLAGPAGSYQVEIIRDNWGVPHIYGKRDADTAFGVAYAHAEDDFETIQEVTAATRGVLARYRGLNAAPTDYIVALLDVWGTIDRRYEADVPADVKAIAEAYAAGLNLYAAQHPGKTWQGLAPFTGEDIVAGFIFKTPFFYGLDKTLLSLFGETRDKELALAPSSEGHAWEIRKRTLSERGSNGIAVSADRSTDGHTRLLINSHQPMTGPVAWWEAHLVSEDGLDISGGLFPGTPVILHGFNRSLGWANTVSKPDLDDVYRLTLNPDNPNQYQLDGEWRDFETSSVDIEVRLWGPFAFTAQRPVLRSVHGPVIQAKHGTYAIRFSGMNEIRQLEQYYRLNKATTLEEFLGAMEMLALPSINYLYADKTGNVAFIHNGQYPNRIEGWDWKKDLPGNRSDLIWQGYRPFDAVPKLINPQSGLVFNANNQPYSATDGPDNLMPDQFPPSMGLQTDETNRSLRLRELTDGTTRLSQQGLLDLKFDKTYALNSKASNVIKDVLALDWSGDPALAQAAAHLAAWDLSLDTRSTHAALGALTVLKEVTAEFTGEPAPSPADAFRFAVSYLKKHYGRIDPEWGEVNRLVRGDLDIPVGGGADVLRAIYPAEIGDDGKLSANAGDTWIALVEWDETGKQSAKVIHQYGAATLDSSSEHYSDQARLFAEQKWRQALLSRADVEANAVRTYRPGRD